jgi:hypothetical protein
MSTRREAIQQMAIIGVGLAATGAASGCMVDGASGDQIEHTDKLIRAFIETVVPDAPVQHPDITLAFRDELYGFTKYRWLFNFDLRKRACKLFGTLNFHKLEILERQRVIEDALRTNGKMKRLYSGAIQLAQLTVYTGFYCEPERCEIIQFDAGFMGGITSYPNPGQFFGRSMTVSGNIA